MSFSQAVSGLNAAANSLDAIGNNIANSATNGFKGAHASFADVFAGSGAGLGVKVAGINQNFSDGPITRTNRNSDVAISGNGFFRVQDGNGEVYYSRDGEFTRDKDGRLVNNQGMVVTGYPARDGQIQTGGVPGPLVIDTDMMDAMASGNAGLTINLNSGDEPIDQTTNPFDPENSDTYNFSTTMNTYDSLGNPHEVAVYFVKTADNKWDMHVKDNSDTTATVQKFGPLEFDTSGKLTSAKDYNFNFNGINGADGGVLKIDIGKTRQQNVSESSVSAISVDGYPAGEYTNFTIEEDGSIVATYSNQQKRIVGQIALTSFANPNGLVSQGGNVWAASGASGNPMNGVPGVGQFGKLTSGALESSNVDMSQELIGMIVTQRNYQSNAQTIKTQDQVLQTLVNLR